MRFIVTLALALVLAAPASADLCFYDKTKEVSGNAPERVFNRLHQRWVDCSPTVAGCQAPKVKVDVCSTSDILGTYAFIGMGAIATYLVTKHFKDGKFTPAFDISTSGNFSYGLNYAVPGGKLMLYRDEERDTTGMKVDFRF